MSDFLDYENNFLKFESVKSNLIYGNLNFHRTPEVTIAIPTYKRPDLLKESIDSALNQIGYENYEVIVVDNEIESNTETEKLIKSYNNPKLFYYKNEKNLGMTGNWNRCLELARGKWYTMLHDDDLLSSNYLKEMLKILNKNPKISFLSAARTHLDERDLGDKDNSYFIKLRLKKIVESFAKKLRKLSEWDYILTAPVGEPGSIMEREKAIKIGGFYEKCNPAEDQVFFIRYCMNYNTYFYNKVLCTYRVLENESCKNGALIAGAKVMYDVIHELKNKSFFRKIFFKKYPAYYYLRFIKHIEGYWQVKVNEEDLRFLEKDLELNFFWMIFYNLFFKMWMLKNIII